MCSFGANACVGKNLCTQLAGCTRAAGKNEGLASRGRDGVNSRWQWPNGRHDACGWPLKKVRLLMLSYVPLERAGPWKPKPVSGLMM